MRRMGALVGAVWPGASVRVFGSFDTGLYLPESDVDLVVVGTGLLLLLLLLLPVAARRRRRHHCPLRLPLALHVCVPLPLLLQRGLRTLQRSLLGLQQLLEP